MMNPLTPLKAEAKDNSWLSNELKNNDKFRSECSLYGDLIVIGTVF